ncbi:hypothetical protein CHS0354_015983 [Potamilus streckersoni]|uniref:Uncharacterized protein n=1 Tax=Potamilus streckersoni TaxID=2493646 RepID=A0AAE0SZC8_9BIVA|nr:hypothetical protein CHS0354_015983 [Potamilus streckersoni]
MDMLKKIIKSLTENWRKIVHLICGLLFFAGLAEITTVIVMTLQNADGKAEVLNRNVAILLIIAGAVAVVTALYIWHKLAGHASTLEVFAQGQEDRGLINSENALVGKVAMEATNV